MEGMNNDCMSFMWIFALLILAGGGLGNGLWGNNGTQAASNQEILFGQQFQALDNKIDRIGNGIADATFALNNAVTTEGRHLSTEIGTLRLENANYAASINSNIDSKFASLEKNQLQQTIQAQAEKINQLQLAQAMCGVVRYPNSSTYTLPAPCGCNCNGSV